jgi:hypothetical protein
MLIKKGIEHNGFNPVQVNWTEVPGRDEKWRQQTLAALNFDEAKFQQEYAVEFMGSSGTLISGWKLKELVHQNPLYEKDGLSMYVSPSRSRSYVCIVDSSKGKGLDYSAFSLLMLLLCLINKYVLIKIIL